MEKERSEDPSLSCIKYKKGTATRMTKEKERGYVAEVGEQRKRKSEREEQKLRVLSLGQQIRLFVHTPDHPSDSSIVPLLWVAPPRSIFLWLSYLKTTTFPAKLVGSARGLVKRD